MLGGESFQKSLQWTITPGGKVAVEDFCVTTETLELVARSAYMIGRPILPEPPIRITSLVVGDILRLL